MINKRHDLVLAFTIVELLVVIVVIGILAAITMVSYSGISKKATAATLQSDLSNAKTQLEIDKINDGAYPSSSNSANGGKGLVKSGNTTYSYSLTPSGYCLSAIATTDSSTSYHVSSEDGIISSGECQAQSLYWKHLTMDIESTCGVSSDDVTWCWGDNANGQLANTSPSTSVLPLRINVSGVLSGKTIKALSSRYFHTCAIASDDQAYCWGYNGFGALGDNSTQDRYSPVAVVNTGVLSGKTIKAISSAGSHTCAIASDNYVYCWGDNDSGELGNANNTQSLVPVAVSTTGALSGKTVKKIVSNGGDENTCVIASDDNAYCWGSNVAKELGANGSLSYNAPVAVDKSGVLSGKTIKEISSGDNHSCVIASDDQVYCWGYNSHGELGNNATAFSSLPVAVNTSGLLSGKTALSIAAGGYHTCIIASDNKAYCWGTNTYGELGNNNLGVNSSVPVAVDTSGILSGKTLTSIVAGEYETCVGASDGHYYCWGLNDSGQLGNQLTSNSGVPVLSFDPSAD